jgi:hypothetical protein
MSAIPVISSRTAGGTSLVKPPAALSSISFTLPQLAGSMARAAAMSTVF